MNRCRLCYQEQEHTCAGNHWCNPLKKRGSWKGLLDGFAHDHKCACCGSDSVVARRSIQRGSVGYDAYYCIVCYEEGRRPKQKYMKVSPFQVFVNACYSRC